MVERHVSIYYQIKDFMVLLKIMNETFVASLRQSSEPLVFEVTSPLI
jgi:hypothetical protein